jgi:hypothetical protein
MTSKPVRYIHIAGRLPSPGESFSSFSACQYILKTAPTGTVTSIIKALAMDGSGSAVGGMSAETKATGPSCWTRSRAGTAMPRIGEVGVLWNTTERHTKAASC